MFRFAEPSYLYLLIILPLFVALYIYYVKSQKKRLAKFGTYHIIKSLMPEVSPLRVRNKFIILVLALFFIVLSLAQPQFGSKLKEVKREGVEIILAVDVSNSMLAEDFAPNRLERTKNAVNQLIERLDKDRVGLIVFAGDAYIQLPITSDYVSAKTFVKGLTTDMVPRQGTSLSKALELANRSFSAQSVRSRAIILITDGESHNDDPLVEAQQSNEESIVIYTVGIGTPEGAPITIDGEMMRDDEGNIVVSKLDEQILQQISVLTGGAYVRASERSVGLEQILSEIDKMQKQEFSSLVFEQYSEQFHYLAIIALFLLFVEPLIINRRNRILSKISIFK